MGINKDIKGCVPRLQQAWAYLQTEYPKRYPMGPTIVLVETFRTAAVQEAYFAQGRQTLAVVNDLRRKAGLYLLMKEENNRRVTQRRAGSSLHERMDDQGRPFSHAFDIGFVAGGKMDYSPLNYQRAARILREVFHEVIWGADWDNDGRSDDEKFIDQPHFQV